MLTTCGVACSCADGSGDGESPDDETEIITTVSLSFTPEGGGDPIIASFRDPDGDGGVSGTADPIVLSVATAYSLEVEFLNDLEDPPRDITGEVLAEAEEHQVLFYGDAPVTHAYADADSSGLPIGLANTITTMTDPGSGEFKVMLRHLPELNMNPQKVDGLAQMLEAGDPLPGDVDADVTFQMDVG